MEAADETDPQASSWRSLNTSHAVYHWRPFSGGASKGLDGLYNEIRGIRDGGGNGSIIGRNTFQRPREEALQMLDTIIKIYQGKE